MNYFKTFCAIFMFVTSFIQAQSTAPYKISYEQYAEGIKISTLDFSILYYNNISYLSKPTAKKQYYLDFNAAQSIDLLKYKDTYYKKETPFTELKKPELEKGKKETILGYSCSYAKYSLGPNTLEIWYTEETEAKGSPSLGVMPIPNALVLKMVINGKREVLVKSIKKISKSEMPFFFPNQATSITASKFKGLELKTRHTTISVFNNEVINFNPKLKKPNTANLETDTTYRLSEGRIILKKIKINPKLLKNSGTIHASLNCKSNGDPFDRTGHVFIVPNSMIKSFIEGGKSLSSFIDSSGKTHRGIIKNESYTPPIELMRFFTSFGAGHFNDKQKFDGYDWKDKATYNQEISSLINNNQEEFWVGVSIGNYDKGGHVVDLDLNFFQGRNTHEKIVEPLFFNLNNYGAFFKKDTLKVRFKMPKNIINPKLLFTTTGHGGWATGDEFIPKLNQLLIDGKPFFKIVPWRTDCATYRLTNPASGNFINGLSSSDLSRSNWCPGMLTAPYVIFLNDISEGEHTIELVIDQGADSGKNFNHWKFSGILTGLKKKDTQ